MAQIFNSREEVVAFLDTLDNSVAKWQISDSETQEVVEGCDSMTDRAAYVWLMENQPTNEDGTGIGKYGILPLDGENASMPWLD
ncbi:MAG: hypothetical protein RLZZ196_2056 [Bacteroidota bacterium]|jgi:hypothetical protein